MPVLSLSGRAIDYEAIAGTTPQAPPLVFLHEGLGSIAGWRDFPARLAAATGAPAVVYSRYGYGRSEALAAPRTPDYMHREALDALPELRRALALDTPILVGHSDGASIALLHAGAGRWPVRALVLEAPHVFVEPRSLAGIAAARFAYESGDLKERLARHHADVDGAFRGWCEAWLSDAFRDWNIEDCLAGIRCPVLLIQGERDGYGTAAQLDAIARGLGGPCERLLLPDCGHTPHREATAPTLAAMVDFIARA